MLPYLTVAENVLLGREPRNGPFIDRGRLLNGARDVFAQAGIDGIEPLELVANLPLAQQQIVEIVKAVSRRPRIIFMDEPTSALAEHSVAWLFGLIKRLRDGGACIVFTSHRWNEIKGIADRITVFRNAEWVATSKAADLSEDQAVEQMTGQRIDVLFPKPVPLESTACDAPSFSTTRMPTTGTPRRGDLAIIDLKPFSHDEMNSRGIEPPLISSANSKSPSNGSQKPATLPY